MRPQQQQQRAAFWRQGGGRTERNLVRSSPFHPSIPPVNGNGEPRLRNCSLLLYCSFAKSLLVSGRTMYLQHVRYAICICLHTSTYLRIHRRPHAIHLSFFLLSLFLCRLKRAVPNRFEIETRIKQLSEQG